MIELYVVVGTGTKYEPNATDVIGVYTTRRLAEDVRDEYADDYDEIDVCPVYLDDIDN